MLAVLGRGRHLRDVVACTVRDRFSSTGASALLLELLGLVLGAAGISAGTALTRWPMVLSWTAVVYPFGISVAIAVVFGTWPALRAARLDPIVALNSQ